MITIFNEYLPKSQLMNFIPKGKYTGIFLYCWGDAKSGVTIAASDCGLVKVWDGDKLKSAVEFEMLQILNNLKCGYVQATSTAGSLFYFSAFLPFVHFDDDACLLVRSDNQWRVEVDCPNMSAANLDSGLYYAAAVPADETALAPYELLLRQYNTSFANAGIFPIGIEGNTDYLVLKNDTNIDYVGAEKDSQAYISYQSRGNLLAATQLFSRQEYQAYTGGILLNFNPTLDLTGSYAKKINITVGLGAATTVKILAVGSYATPNRLNESAAARNLSIEKKVTTIPSNIQGSLKNLKV